MTLSLSTNAKEAIKTALGVTLAYGIALSMGWEKEMWAGFTVAFVSLGSVGESVHKMVLRISGTLLGVTVAITLLGLFSQQRWSFLIGLSGWVAFCTYMLLGDRVRGYVWQVAGFVPPIIALSALADPPHAFDIAMLRLQETGLGIVVYSVIALLLWPVSVRGAFDALLVNIVTAQRNLYRAYLDLLRGASQGNATRPMRTKVVHLLGQLPVLLDAAIAEGGELARAHQRFGRFERHAVALAMAMEQLRESFAEVSDLGIAQQVTNFDAFSAEIEHRFDAIEKLLAGDAHDAPVEMTLTWDRAALAELSPVEQAALAVTGAHFQQIESSTRALIDDLAQPRGATPESVAAVPPRVDTMAPLDMERLRGVLHVLIIQWVAYLAWIYVPDLPSATTFVIVTTSIGIATTTMPQINVLTLVGPVLRATVVGALVYIFIMPKLGGFVGLGLMLFGFVFALCYLNSSPQQALGRVVGLTMFLMVTSITNWQSYSLLMVANMALVVVLVLLVVAATAQLSYPALPEKMVLRMIARFFRSSAYLMGTASRPRSEWTLWRRLQAAFHEHELNTLGDKLAMWGQLVDPQVVASASREHIAALVDSVGGIGRRLQVLIDEYALAPLDARPAIGLEWCRRLQQLFDALAADPRSVDAAHLRATLADSLGRLDAYIIQAQGGRTALIDNDEAASGLRLLGAHRNVSESLVEFTESAAGLDWPRWREERFA
jgi:uncharacterized membrane protein YccC